MLTAVIGNADSKYIIILTTHRWTLPWTSGALGWMKEREAKRGRGR